LRQDLDRALGEAFERLRLSKARKQE
jgi:hypothetical protein